VRRGGPIPLTLAFESKKRSTEEPMKERPMSSSTEAANIKTVKSYCRFCHAYCAIEVDVEVSDAGERVLAVRGDREDPMYGGYTCEKGRELPDVHNHPERIRESLKRNADGGYDPIPTQQALDEIAEKLKTIVAENGPASIASYNGTHAFQNSAELEVCKAWHAGIESPSYYSSITIDQPAKFIAPSRVGNWAGGTHGFESADVVMIIGNNALISHYSPFGGLPPFNAFKRLRDCQRRGLKVICVDPRRTELAKRSDLHLQLKPGEDPTLLAGIVKVMLDEGLYDAEFCEQWVDGVAELHEAIKDFTPEYVEERADVPAAQVIEAARLFAGGPRGTATAGTGHNMSMRPNLSEHLTIVLNVLCGRFNREGEKIPNPGVIGPAVARRAQAVAPEPVFGVGPQLRTRDLGQVFGEMPSAAISDEILLEGEGQIKALLCIGGNPVVAFPDQEKTLRALEKIDLFVSIDRKMSASARHADYILAPRLSLEREDTLVLTDPWYEEPYGHYTEAAVKTDLDVIEEWEFYWELASRMGTPIVLNGEALSLDEKPSKFEVLEKILANPRVPLAKVREQDGGHIFEEVEAFVLAAEEGASQRMQVAPPGVADELRDVRGETLKGDAGYAGEANAFSHRLICRRLNHVYNSSGQELPAMQKRGTTNSAYMNPEDLTALGIKSGDLIEISSDASSIVGVAEATEELKPGVISMAHAYGGGPEVDGKVREWGSSTNRLVDASKNYDPISGMPRQSGIPVNVRPAAERAVRA
jgi:anaerobic selenocysteine-containing dehydrogenase